MKSKILLAVFIVSLVLTGVFVINSLDLTFYEDENPIEDTVSTTISEYDDIDIIMDSGEEVMYSKGSGTFAWIMENITTFFTALTSVTTFVFYMLDRRKKHIHQNS